MKFVSSRRYASDGVLHLKFWSLCYFLNLAGIDNLDLNPTLRASSVSNLRLRENRPAKCDYVMLYQTYCPKENYLKRSDINCGRTED